MNLTNAANIEKLSDKNYESWCLQVKSVLICSDLWEYANGDMKEPEDVSKKAEWKIIDSKALAMIILSVKENQLGYIKKATTSNEAWTSLEKIYASKGPAKKVMLYKQLFYMKKKCDHSMAQHVREFQDHIHQLEETGITLPAELLSIMLLNTLPPEYENFNMAIGSRDTLPSLDNLKIKLLEEETRREETKNNSENDESTEQRALISKKSYKKGWKEKNRKKQFEPKPSCGKRGHMAADCRTRRTKRKEYEKKETAMNAVTLKELTFNANSGNSVSEAWCLDSGASTHMCNNRNLFTEWTSHTQSQIQTAGTDTISAYGSGKVVLHIANKSCFGVDKITLNDVIYVPSLKQNLISVSRAARCGYKINFRADCAVVLDRSESKILTAVRHDNLYFVNTVKHFAYASGNKESLNNLLKWHERFGHLNFTDLMKLKRQNLVTGLDCELKMSDLKCVVCSKSKITQLPYPKSNTREHEVLDVVHSDICGPFSTESVGGAKYFATFIDSRSRYIEVVFLKRRSDILAAFKNYQKVVELQTGRKIKCIRSDNAKEYISKDFSDHLQKGGMKRQLSIEYTPQQNGVAERANRTLLDMARCMLLESGLPKSLWAEAVNTAAFIRNRSPTAILENQTPFEVWHNRKPNVSFFKKFGSIAISLEKGPRHSKLDPKGKEYIFVGYSAESKGYRLWDGQKSVIKRRDVKILEKSDPNNYVWFDIPSATVKKSEIKEDNIIIKEENDEVITESEENAGNETFESATGSFLGFDESSETDEFTGDEETDEPNNQRIDEKGGQDIYEEPEETSTRAENTESGENINKSQRKRGRPKILRTGRPGRPRKIYGEEVNIALRNDTNNYLSFEEALERSDRQKWVEAMKNELGSLNKNSTWTLVDRPVGRKVLSNKWVFSIKRKSDGSIQKYKARLVVRGCEQRYGIDYEEVFAPVARYESLRMLLALAAEKELHLHQMDVVTAYVQGELNEEIYMEQPKTAENKHNDPEKVCRLLKPLYGLKQAGYMWHKKLKDYLISIGMKQATADQCLYVKHEDDAAIYILIYVDDILLASKNLNLLKETKKSLASQFEMKDLGRVTDILGIHVQRESETGKVQIEQKHYIEKLLQKFGMKNAKSASTPMDVSQNLTSPYEEEITHEEEEEMKSRPYRELIGGLVYLSNTTRPDISFATNLLSRFVTNPREIHWKAGKRILRYLKGTKGYRITYEKTNKNVECFVDSDWASDLSDRKSCSGYVVMMSNGPIIWKSKKQKSTSLSTMEAEYVALSEAVKEVMYLRKVFEELNLEEYSTIATPVYCDNQSAVKLSSNNTHHEKSKHIDIRFHFSREKQNEGQVKISYTPSDEMTADILTKGLPKLKHGNCVTLLKLDT